MKRFAFELAAAAVSAFACHFAVVHATPVDRALPLIGGVLGFLFPAAVPFLIAAEIAFAHEATRLILFGAVVAATFVWTAAAPASPGFESGSSPGRTPKLAVAALILLRWIPTPEHILREVVLLALAVAIAWLLRNTPFALTLAVVVVLMTPAVPLRTLALPLAIAAALFVVRFFHMPRIALTVPSLFLLAFVLTFFAWSGVVARAFPYFTRPAKGEVRRHAVNQALAASRSTVIDVPWDATALIVSGANVARLRSGTPLGVIEPGGIPIRVGDGADWGYMRREFFYGGHNPLPREAVGRLREYGYAAWVDGAGTVALPRGAKQIRVTADRALPPGASLQVEGFALR